MLPNDEWDRFLDVSVRAATLAQRGAIALGHETLTAGLAEARERFAAGECWADEMARHYQRALELYENKYGAELLK